VSLERSADLRILDARQLFAQRRLVEGGEPSQLLDELVDAGAQRPRRQLVPVGLDPRDLRRGDLVVDRIPQGLEVAALLLNRTREVSGLADRSLVVAHVEAALKLVGQQVVARLVEVLEGQVALEEARRVARLVLGAGEATVGAHLRELVVGVGLDEELLEHVAPHEIVVLRKLVPQEEVAGEEVRDVHALAGEGLGPRLAEGGAEARPTATGAHDAPVLQHHGLLLAVTAHAEVLGIGALLLAEAEFEVLVQRALLRVPELGTAGVRGSHRPRDENGHREPEGSDSHRALPPCVSTHPS
jgi:hypothetical protein